MSAATPSRSGQIAAAGATDALWLKVFSGEVLTAFETAVKTAGRIRRRDAKGMKSAQFPATFRAQAEYHTPGAEILGQSIEHNEVTITLDDLLIAPAFVAQIDELKNHYDVRAPYSTELGNALALLYDRSVTQCILAAAAGAELFAGDGGGSTITEANVGVSADFTTSGSDLISAVNLAKQAMDEKDVPVETMTVNAMFLPAQWYLIANSDKNIDKDFGGDGSTAKQVLRTVSDVEIIKSNAPLFGKDVTLYDGATNTDGLVGHPTDPKRLPLAFPSKYRAIQTTTVGAVWVESAAAVLQAMGVTLESQWDIRRQGTLMVAKMAFGGGPLRSKCAVALKTS